MRKTLAIAALMLAFCCPALAGEIPTPPAPQPQAATVDGIMPNEGADGLTQIALDLLAALF